MGQNALAEGLRDSLLPLRLGQIDLQWERARTAVIICHDKFARNAVDLMIFSEPQLSLISWSINLWMFSYPSGERSQWPPDNSTFSSS